jgi:hypothetical protein
MTPTKELARLDPDAVAELLGIEPLPVTAADMAWMAGVIDVKGATLRKNNKTRRTPQVVLYVQEKDERIARRLSALTGIKPEAHARPLAEAFLRRNCAEHCVTPHVHVGTDAYPWQMPQTTRWALTGIAAAVVLANLAPFMSTYADYAADVAEVVGNFAAAGHGSGAVRKTLLRLSALGWQIPAAVTVRLAEGGEHA